MWFRRMGGSWMALLLMLVWSGNTMGWGDTNAVFSPCADTTVQRLDGFTLGLAFSSRDKFFFRGTQPSPCDPRFQLPSAGAQLALFRPKVDEISVFTLDDSPIKQSASGGYMVAFVGNKYAARSPPTFVADSTRVVTNFALVLEFDKGILYNLYWDKLGCGGFPVEECVDQQDCAVQASKCRSDRQCNLGINVLFSGTDKHHQVLNSWYETNSLRDYSLFGLYPSLRNRINNLF